MLTATSSPARRTARRYRGQTWGAIGAGVLCLALAATGGVLLLAHPGPVPVAITLPTPLKPDQLVVGHCLKALPSNEQVRSIVAVPCTTGHRGEVIAAVTLRQTDQDGRRPASNDLAQTVESTCATVPLVDVPPDAHYVAWVPTQESWDRGDRRGLCILAAPTLVGSALS